MPGLLTSLYKMTHKEKLIKQVRKQDHMLTMNTPRKDTLQQTTTTANLFFVLPENYNNNPSTRLFFL